MTATTVEVEPLVPDRVEVLLFDLGRVVFDFDWRRAVAVWSDASGVPAATIVERFAKEVHYERYERGEISSEEYFTLLRQRLELDVDLDVIAQGWNAIFGELVPGISEVIAAVHDSPYRLAALSNTNAAHAVTFGARFAPVLADLGRILASHELGHRKPEASCYLAACEHLATDPSHVLFFDDLAANVSGARGVGMQAVLVEGTPDVVATLRALGIDAPASGEN